MPEMTEETKGNEGTKADGAKEEKKNYIVRDTTKEGASEKSKEMETEKSVYIEYTQEDGSVLKGEFTFKRPTIAMYARIGVRKAELSLGFGEGSLDAFTANLHEWMATCDVCVIKNPTWFNASKLYDVGPYRVVYDEVRKFIRTFRRDSVDE